ALRRGRVAAQRHAAVQRHGALDAVRVSGPDLQLRREPAQPLDQLGDRDPAGRVRGGVVGRDVRVLAGGVVGVQQQRHLVGDVGQCVKHGGDTVLVAAGEVFDVLVQAGQTDPVGEVDGDHGALVEHLAVGDEPQLDPGDVGAAVQPVWLRGQDVVDGVQEAAHAGGGQFVVHSEAFGAAVVRIFVAGLGQPHLDSGGVDG